jgi:hypothetical protein
VGSIIKNKNISRYFIWNDYVREVDYWRVKDFHARLMGRGGTDTVPVANKIVSEKLTNIILITDAEIPSEVVKKTDQVLENAALHQFRI